MSKPTVRFLQISASFRCACIAYLLPDITAQRIVLDLAGVIVAYVPD